MESEESTEFIWRINGFFLFLPVRIRIRIWNMDPDPQHYHLPQAKVAIHDIVALTYYLENFDKSVVNPDSLLIQVKLTKNLLFSQPELGTRH